MCSIESKKVGTPLHSGIQLGGLCSHLCPCWGSQAFVAPHLMRMVLGHGDKSQVYVISCDIKTEFVRCGCVHVCVCVHERRRVYVGVSLNV